MIIERPYTLKEEILNALTHGVGVGFGIAALVILITASAKQYNEWKIVSSALFGSTIILLYLASTLHHSFSWSPLKRFFKTLDHSAIFLLIAGTYTPICLVTLRGDWGWTLFGMTWGLALAGIIFKIFFIYRFQVISLIIYILMGWLAIIVIDPIVHHLPLGGLIWLALGGLCYTLGTIFYSLDNKHYMHCIWHLFVLAGTICHFFTILYYVIPY